MSNIDISKIKPGDEAAVRVKVHEVDVDDCGARQAKGVGFLQATGESVIGGRK